MTQESQKFLEAAIQAAHEAGELLKKGFGTQFGISSKEGSQNLVTEYDTLCQEKIIKRLKNQFPSHSFLAEEDPNAPINHQEVVWLIDPLDGTVNFAHTIPFFAVSIAAVLQKEIVAGVVYHPMGNELFTARKGMGAYLNGKKIHVTKRSQLQDTLLATGFPYNVKENPEHCVDQFVKFLKLGIPLRRLGAAALDLSYVAAGRFDGFWEVGLHPWDMAAGKLLVEEAGGQVSHYDGSPHKIFGYYSTVATNKLLHEQLIEKLKHWG